MNGMKKRNVMIAALMAISIFMPNKNELTAEEDFSNTEYWNAVCMDTYEMTQETKEACEAYMEYMASQSEELEAMMAEAEERAAMYQTNIEAMLVQIADYQDRIDALTVEINDLNAKIKVKEKEIAQKEVEIQDMENTVEDLKAKVRTRVAQSQSSMRLNKAFDILMGAATFEDFIRIANGLQDITNYDRSTLEKLNQVITELNEAKALLETAKKELEDTRAEAKAKQDTFLALQYESQLALDTYREYLATTQAEMNQISANISAIQSKMAEIADALATVVASGSWLYPVPGARITAGAGTWYYAGGSVHLGADYGSGVVYGSTYIVAVGNGVILNTADGCPYGYLGSTCGYTQGGSQGGGNQVYLLTQVDDGLYLVKYLHLLAGSLAVSRGDIVNAGDYLALVGSSGNSTGPHCHIEVFYLGPASNFSNYAQTWDGDLAFGCGWGYSGLNRLCQNGVGAPCRLRPEDIFGG